MRCASALCGLTDASSLCLSLSLPLCLHKSAFHMSPFQSNSMKLESDIKPTFAYVCLMLHADVLNFRDGQLDSNIWLSFYFFDSLVLLLCVTLWHSFIIIFLLLTPLIFFEILHFFHPRNSLKVCLGSCHLFLLSLILICLFAHSPNICLMSLSFFPRTETKGQQYLWDFFFSSHCLKREKKGSGKTKEQIRPDLLAAV